MKNVNNNSALFPTNSTRMIPQPALAEDTLKLAVQVVVAVLGSVGNILVCVVVSRQSRKQLGTNLYIQILSIADFLVLSVNFPLAVIGEKLPNNWPFGEFICRYFYPIPETFYGASVWIIVAIAVERYRGIVMGAPVKGKQVLKRVKITVTCLWLTSFTVFSLPLCFFTVYEETLSGKLCRIDWPDFAGANTAYKIYAVSLMLCSYAFPLFVFMWTYFSIMHRLRKSNSFVKTMFRKKQGAVDAFSQTQLRRINQNKRANRILTPVVVLFAVSMFPLTVLRTVIPFWIELVLKPFFPNLIYAASVGATVNSAANPLIYSISCREFRQDLRDFFCKAKDKDALISRSTLLSLATTFDSLKTTTL